MKFLCGWSWDAIQARMPLFKKLFLVDNVLNSGSSAARIFYGPESHRAMHLLVFLRHPSYEKDLMSSYGNLVKINGNEIKTLNPPVKNIKVPSRKTKSASLINLRKNCWSHTSSFSLEPIYPGYRVRVPTMTLSPFI